ncbi:hypothetical protein KAF25_011081 [Fusarium avenaceum]|uniref:Hsp70 protein n=1 Tax=Fusarium avenaceum TaxID=40199 RepID=A0A9P7GU06_9HYPO|nr:hypothetical protein KAF25_011081 [Fusarium avenaceum]
MSVSRASTQTLGREDAIQYRNQSHDDSGPEHINLDVLDKIYQGPPPKRLIIGIDFGTTYSAVSYVDIPEGCPSESIDPSTIKTIQGYPSGSSFNPNDQMLMEVPTEVIYPLDSHFRDNSLLNHVEPETDSESDPDVQHESPDSTFSVPMDDRGPRDEDEDGDISMMTDPSSQFRWGYEVHDLWSIPATHSDNTNQPLSRFKLLLDGSQRTQRIRDDLNDTLVNLKRRKVIKKPLHVIADFLTHLLAHTQSELQKKGFDDSYHREIVLSVPAIWTEKACRDMQSCLAEAMQRANFQNVDIQNNSIENLFIVSEPEAAAAYMLGASLRIKHGDTFVLLDAGGGTVDANTYQVSKEDPLRLTNEVVAPGGGLHGSSYLNEGFREYLLNLLKDETYLEHGTETIKGIVEKYMIDKFEYQIKRCHDCSKPPGVKLFPISHLRDNQSKGFRRGSAVIRTSIIDGIFQQHLVGIGNIMEQQITEAKRAGCKVNKVVLIGGFGTSVSLIQYLEDRLAGYCTRENEQITLIRPEEGKAIINAVASGAVIRALNKSRGPERIARSSYGILRTEPFREHKEHEGLHPSYDPHDGQAYIKGTIDWVLKLGQVVAPVWQWAEKVGEIVVDFSFLRTEGLIAPIDPTFNENGQRIGKRHYKVNFTMAIRVVDRDLECKY